MPPLPPPLWWAQRAAAVLVSCCYCCCVAAAADAPTTAPPPPPLQMLPEDAFARRRQQLALGAVGCVPGVASVGAQYATLLNGSRIHLGARIPGRGDGGGGHCGGGGQPSSWMLVALAPADNTSRTSGGGGGRRPQNSGGAAVWEQQTAENAVWGISMISGAGAPGAAGSSRRRAPVVLPKPVGSPGTVTYPSLLPPWFIGTYWRETVLPSAQDVLADRLLLPGGGNTSSYGQIAPVLPRLTGQMGEKLESVRHRGGPSFVSAPSSDRWWQVRQNGEVVVGDTATKEGTAALPVLHSAFRPGFAHPDLACEWPNHDGPGPQHGTACMHVQGLMSGWLPIINQGLRDTNGRSAIEQLIMASGDSLFLANRSGTVDGGWGLWSFYWTPPENSRRLERATTGSFVTALLSVVADARGFVEDSALSESRLRLPAEPLLADAARASLLLARATYTGLHPHYGIGSSYSAPRNDGFPPTTLAMVRTLCAVDAASAAADRLGYFLHNMVNNKTGDVIYYGTAVSEYGQLLQAAAAVVIRLENQNTGAGRAWISNPLHGVALGRIAEKLIAAQTNASAHRSASGGLLWGCPEADLCSKLEGRGLFFSSGLWAWRGMVDLAAAAEQLSLTTLGNVASVADMKSAAAQLREDTLAAVATSADAASGWLPPCLKCLRSAEVAFQNMTQSRIASYTNYRFWPEMLSSGGLPALVAEGLGRYRQSHGGELFGMTRFSTWMDDWPLPNVALWWLDLWPNSSIGSANRFSMATLSHLSHHSTRGTFTAFEQANWADSQADNCVPSQLVVPLLLPHMLVHVTQTPGVQAEKRVSTIWLHRGIPRHWFAHSGGFSIINASVWSGGAISTVVQVHPRSATCQLTVCTPSTGTPSKATRGSPICNIILKTTSFGKVTVNGKAWTDVDIESAVVRNVPCVVPSTTGVTTTSIVVMATDKPPPSPPAPTPAPPPPHEFPPQPVAPPKCNCSNASDCSFVVRAARSRNVFAYLDDGGPANNRDNWESALNWSAVTHVIRNTHHPLLVAEDGGVVLNDALWPTKGKDAMLCTAHRKGVRVLADVDPLAFDARYPSPALQEATFLRNRSAVRRAAREIGAWITAAGYDGAGFDFEGLSVGSWSLEFEHEVGDGLISLVRQTRAALRVSNPSAEVAFAVSTNNNKWFNSSYRMAEITAEIDYTILMGYDMWHRNTDAGPNAPLPALKAALRSFLHGWGTPASKLVLGIPWYGYTYRCQQPVPLPLPQNPIYVPGMAADGGKMPSRPNCSAGVAPSVDFPRPCCAPWAPYSNSAAREFEALLANKTANCSAKVFDSRSGSTVFECHQAGQRFQSWYDDATATATKASLADQLQLGGLAVWTVGNAPSGALGAQYWQAFSAYTQPSSNSTVQTAHRSAVRGVADASQQDDDDDDAIPARTMWLSGLGRPPSYSSTVLSGSINIQTAGDNVQLQIPHAMPPQCQAELVDCTDVLQASLNRSGTIVVGPRTAAGVHSWPTRPLRLRSHTHITFMPGTEVTAMAGEFHGLGDCLFSTTAGAANVTIVGWGATWRMRRADYADNRTYTQGEWRAGLVLIHSSNVHIYGLTITETGGDGIYIIRSRDLLLDGVILDRCYRQGISVIAATNMLVINSTFSNTGQGTLSTGAQLGTPPMCGVDLEPDQAEDSFINITFAHCRALNNFGCGFAIALSRSTNATPALDVQFHNCSVDGGAQSKASSPPMFCSEKGGCNGYPSAGLSVFGAYGTFPSGANSHGVPGTIIFDGLVISNTFEAGISISNVASSALKIQVLNSVLQSVARRSSPLNATEKCSGSFPVGIGAPLVFQFWPGYATGDLSAHLSNASNLTVIDNRQRPWVLAAGCGGHSSSRLGPVSAKIKGGKVLVRNPFGCFEGANIVVTDVKCESAPR